MVDEKLGELGGTLFGGNTEPSKYPQGYFKKKGCGVCGEIFTPTNPCNRYCCEDCALVAKANAYLKRQYGITYDDYQDMFLEQGGKCRICDGFGFPMDPHRHKVGLVVDHCHTTGRVRGLLCHNCNRGLGLFQDQVDLLERARDYLKA